MQRSTSVPSTPSIPSIPSSSRVGGATPPGRGEDGFSTAELLGNAALGIAVLVVIWALLQGLGAEVVTWIRGQILGG